MYPTPTNSEGISKLKNEPPHEIIDNMDIEIDFILPLNAIKQYILELEWPVAEEENDVQKSSSPDDLIVKYRAVVLSLTAEMKNCIMSRKSHLMNYIGNLLSEAINSSLPFQSNDLRLLFNENQIFLKTLRTYINSISEYWKYLEERYNDICRSCHRSRNTIVIRNNPQILWLYPGLISRRNCLEMGKIPNSKLSGNYAFTIILYKIASDGIVLIPEIRLIIEECKRQNKILKGLCIKYGLVETRLVPAD